jgi:predicted permease
MNELIIDVRYGLRQLRQSPAFTTIAVLTLALAIGANTAIFGVVNGLLLRSIAVSEPHRLVSISSDFAVSRGFKAGLGWNLPMWQALRDRADAFGGAFAWASIRANRAEGGGVAVPIDVLQGSGEFFSVLGVPALRGRVFTLADDVPGGGPDGPVAVISYRMWQQRFGGAASALGARLLIEHVPFTVIGVTPPDFLGIEVGRAFDVVIPLQTDALLRPTLTSPYATNFLLIVMLRLDRGQSLESATATIQAMQPQLLSANRFTPRSLEEPFVLLPAASGTSGYGAGASGLRQQYERPLATLLVLVALVLLVACVDIAHLLLSRGASRRHEFSVRTALGVPRGRLLRQLLVESVLLAGIGGALGLPLGVWISRALVAGVSAPDSPIRLDLSLDWRVLAFTAVVTIATTLVFGTVPALRATRVQPIEALRARSEANASTWLGRRSRVTLQDGLMATQIALSLVLVVAAGLFVGTFERMARAPLGLDADRILLVNVDTSRAHRDRATRNAFYHRIVDAVAAVPGVARAAGSAMTPLSPPTRSAMYAEPGRVPNHMVSPGWFATYGTPLVSGRDFDTTDRAEGLPVIIVNDAYVRQYFPDRDALGQSVDARTVVGVASNAVFGSVREGMRPTTYQPMSQSGTMGPPDRASLMVSVRAAAGSPASLSPAIAAALTAIHPAIAFSFRPLSDDVSSALTVERVVAMLSGFFAGLALLLAGLGLYGTTSHAVTRRRQEIGIRMALGARPAQVVRLILGRAAALTIAGTALGTAAAAGATRYLESQLFGIRPSDPATFVVVALTLAGLAALAAWVPAHRATRIDPLAALRDH